MSTRYLTRCERCGTTCDARDRFCHECGAPLAAPPAVRGRRRPELLISRGEGWFERILAVLLVLGALAGGGYAWWVFRGPASGGGGEAVVVSEPSEPGGSEEAPEDRGGWLAELVRPSGSADWWSGVTEPSDSGPGPFVPRDRASRRVAAGEAASLDLADGTRLELPAGALRSDQEVSLRVFGRPEGADEALTLYDVHVGDEPLDSPATLTLPLDDPAKVKVASDVVVKRLDGETGKWMPLEPVLSADGKAVTVQSDRFSPVVKAEPWSWTIYATRAQYNRTSAGPLRVPYHSQDSAQWCWAASLAMVEDFHGARRSVWEIGHEFGVDPKSGSPNDDALKAYAKRRGLSAEVKWWWDESAARGYLMWQLDQGRPVLFFSVHSEHVVLAVGYDDTNVYVNDPSGALLEDMRGAAKVSEQALAAQPISWPDWKQVFDQQTLYFASRGGRTTASQYNPLKDVYPNQTLVLTGKPPVPRGLSMQLLPGFKSFSATHVKPHFKVDVVFEWDGRQPGGWFFQHQGVGIPTNHHVSIPHAICNSERLPELRPRISNTSGAPMTVSVEVLLDGKPLGSAKVEVPVGTNHTVKVPTPDFDLEQRPLVPGPHLLKVTAQAGAEFDEFELPFEVYPALVPGVNAARVDDRHVRVRWSPGPESTVLGRELVYTVYRGERRSQEAMQQVAHVDSGDLEVTLELTEEQAKKDWFYAVRATDTKTARRSVDAVAIKATRDRDYFPLLPGTELHYRWSMSIPKMKGAPRFEMSEVFTVPAEGRMVSMVTQKVTDKDMRATANVTVERSFRRGAGQIELLGSTFSSRVQATHDGKRADVKLSGRERSLSPGLLLTAESRLNETKTWTSAARSEFEFSDISGQVSGMGRITRKNLPKGLPGLDPSQQSALTLGEGGTFTVAGFEEVKVPGGTFDHCVKLVRTGRGANHRGTTTIWLAPGVGPVKEVHAMHGPKEVGTITMTKVLSRPPQLPK